MLRDEIAKYTELSGNDGEHTPIGIIGAYLDGYDKGLELSVSENPNKWIPVSERLPEMGVRVLCACQADLYDVLKLTPDGWFYDARHTYMFGFVLAWQPLPEPYKAESEDKE